MSVKRLTGDKAKEVYAKSTANVSKYGALWSQNDTPIAVAGTKYNHVGTSRTGLASYMDKGIIEHNLQQREKNYGGGGYRFQMIDKEGKPDQNATLNINGRVHQARPDGTFYTIDQAYLDLCAREEKERKDYIKGIVAKCCISDNVCATILDLDKDEMTRIMEGKGKDVAQVAIDLGISEALASQNCLPSYLDCLSEDSTFFTGGVSKLTKIVSLLLPVIEDATPASVETKGEE